jgi:hypothetical protein
MHPYVYKVNGGPIVLDGIGGATLPLEELDMPTPSAMLSMAHTFLPSCTMVSFSFVGESA